MKRALGLFVATVGVLAVAGVLRAAASEQEPLRWILRVTSVVEGMEVEFKGAIAELWPGKDVVFVTELTPLEYEVESPHVNGIFEALEGKIHVAVVSLSVDREQPRGSASGRHVVVLAGLPEDHAVLTAAF